VAVAGAGVGRLGLGGVAGAGCASSAPRLNRTCGLGAGRAKTRGAGRNVEPHRDSSGAPAGGGGSGDGFRQVNQNGRCRGSHLFFVALPG